MEYGKEAMEKIKKRKIPKYQEGEKELPRKKIKTKEVEADQALEEVDTALPSEEESTEERSGPKVEIRYDKSILAGYIKKVKENSAELIEETLTLRFEEALRSTIKSFAEETVLPIVKERSQEFTREKRRFKRLAKMCADEKAVAKVARLGELDLEDLKMEMMSTNNYVKAYLAVFEKAFEGDSLKEVIKKEKENIAGRLDIEDVFTLKIL